MKWGILISVFSEKGVFVIYKFKNWVLMYNFGFCGLIVIGRMRWGGGILVILF